MSLKYFILALATIASATPLQPLNKASNDDPCEPCQPKGATGTNPPSIGSDLSGLYTNVLSSVKDIKFQSRDLSARDSGFCCRASLDCVNLQNLNIPMCYDKFTTNFGFADGSYGSLTTGEYKSGDNTANLLTGEYKSSGQQGNIYSASPDAKPNTATLSIPPQFTGTGVGSAVPPGQLGSVVVFTTTIPGTTYSGPTTIPGSMVVKTISGQVVSTSVAPSTITEATTVAPKTALVTTTGEAPASTGGAMKIGAGVFGAVMLAAQAL